MEILNNSQMVLVNDLTPTENHWEEVIEDYLGIEIPDQKAGREKISGLGCGGGTVFAASKNQGSYTFLSHNGRKALTLFADGKVIQRECYDNHGIMQESCDLDSMIPLEGRVDPLKASLLLAALRVPCIVLDPVNISAMAELYDLQAALREASEKDASERCPMTLY